MMIRTTLIDDKEHANKIINSINECAHRVSRLLLPFLLFCIYILIIAFTTNDLILLKNLPLVLPVLQVKLPPEIFCITSASIIFVLYANLIINVSILKDKCKSLKDLFEKCNFNIETKTKLKQLLNIYPNITFITEIDDNNIRHSFSVIYGFVILVILPLATILYQFYKFYLVISGYFYNLYILVFAVDIGLILVYMLLGDPKYMRKMIVSVVILLILISGISYYLSQFRFIRSWNLNDSIIIKNELSEETIATLNTDDPEQLKSVRNRIIPFNFNGKNFQYANFKNSILVGAEFGKSTNGDPESLGEAYQGGNLFRANFEGVQLYSANLTKIKLAPKRYQDGFCTDSIKLKYIASSYYISSCLPFSASFRHAKLQKANLVNACLINVDFSNAKMQHAKLDGAKFIVNNLRNANLNGANLTGADLSGSDIDGATFIGTTFRETRMSACQFKNIKLTQEQKKGVITENKWNLPSVSCLRREELKKRLSNRCPEIFRG